MCNLNIEIRKLSPKSVFELSQILEVGKGWKELMAIVSNENGTLKYTVEHMSMIENASEKHRRLCSEIFLEEWGSSGKEMPHVSDLLKMLRELHLFRAADYVSVNLLKQEPEERILLDQSNSILTKLDEISPLDLPSAPPMLSDLRTVMSDVPQLHQTLPMESNFNGMVCIYKMKHYTYDELAVGTKGFSADMELGHGGFGDVYKCFVNGISEAIAVKRLRTEGVAIRGKEEAFRTEVLTLSNFSHPNLLSLIGYSCDGPHLCLMYPYMVNGSLQDRIECKDEVNVIEWTDRYKIACGTAKGLLHLHTHGERPLVHRDVKSANILLDEELRPKVGDFGLARHGSAAQNSGSAAVTTTVLGTSAYMAPEAFRGDVSVKMDVFSFGVVLLELITGLPPFDEDREGCDLASHVDEVDDIEEIIDMRPKVANLSLALAIYDIAQKCLQEKRTRPDMSVTLNFLESISKNTKTN